MMTFLMYWILKNILLFTDGLFLPKENPAENDDFDTFVQIFKERGLLIPEDIAIVGFNNDSVSVLVEPRLTTVNYPGFDIGVVAATHLTKQLAGTADTNLTNCIVLNSELIVRESSLKNGRLKTE